VAFDIAIELGKSPAVVGLVSELSDGSSLYAGAVPGEAQHDVWSENKAACIATSAGSTGAVTVDARRLPPRRPLVLVQRLRHSDWIMIGGSRSAPARIHPTCGFIWVPVSQ